MTEIELWDGRRIPRLGVGCWAIGGEMTADGKPGNYGQVDDRDAVTALRRAHELGLRLFDTAEAYGMGHSESLLGEALAGFDDVVIVSKFGYHLDFEKRAFLGVDVSPAHIRAALEGSLRRLRRERVDVYLLHVNELPPVDAAPVFDTLETLRAEGKIASFGWSTDHPAGADSVIERAGLSTFEFDLNVFDDAPALVERTERKGALGLARLPLAMGLLSEKYGPDSRMPADDLRGSDISWIRYFKDGRPSPEFLSLRDRVIDLLRFDGRTTAQGALGWILARSPRVMPIPGFKRPAQLEENAAALTWGPLPPDVVREIERELGRGPAN